MEGQLPSAGAPRPAAKDGDRPERADWVSGASLAIRPALLWEGLRFDEGYFLYYEETDLCRTVRGQGWECWYLPQACVLHISGQSTGITDPQAKPRRLPAYWFESRHRYFRKNHGRIYALFADLAWMASHSVFLAKQALRREQSLDPPRPGRFRAAQCLLPAPQMNGTDWERDVRSLGLAAVRLSAPFGLWRIRVPARVDPRLAACLSDEEQARAARFRFPELANRYRVAHGALRLLGNTGPASRPRARLTKPMLMASRC